MWWRKVQSTGSGVAKVTATRVVDDAMLLHNGVWGLVRSLTGGQKAAEPLHMHEARRRLVALSARGLLKAVKAVLCACRRCAG